MHELFQGITQMLYYYKKWQELLPQQRLSMINNFSFMINFMFWMLLLFLIFYFFSNLSEQKLHKKLKSNLINPFNRDYKLASENRRNELFNEYIRHYSIEKKYYNKKINNQILSYIVIIFLSGWALSCELREIMILDALRCMFSKLIFMKISLFIFVTMCLIADLWYVFKLYGIYYASNHKIISSLQKKASKIEENIYRFKTRKENMISSNKPFDKKIFYKEKIIFYPNGNESEFYRDNNGTLQIKIKCFK